MEIQALLRWALGIGLEGRDLTAAQMGLRAAVVYLAIVLIVRIGKRRFLGGASIFDVILGIMVGAVASYVVTGNAPFLPTMAAATVLVVLHWLFSALAARWHGFGSVFKGHSQVLVRDGVVDRATLRRAHMSERDLEEALRLQGIPSVDRVALARLERNGRVSVLPARRDPKVVEIAVPEGVRRVRVELG